MSKRKKGLEDYIIAFNTEILHRFLGDKGLEELDEEYRRHLYRGRVDRIVTEFDRKCLKMHQEGLTFSEIAQKLKVSQSKVQTAVRKAALEALASKKK